VFYLDIDPVEASKRPGYGEEIYENVDFQKLVQTAFFKLKDDSWRVLFLFINKDNRCN
jgi:dTMP kinase